jgi:hypothetical protein
LRSRTSRKAATAYLEHLPAIKRNNLSAPIHVRGQLASDFGVPL